MKIIPKKVTLYLFLAIILEFLAVLITLKLLFWEIIIEFSISFIPIFIIAYFLGQKINFQRFSTKKNIITSILILFGVLYLYIIISSLIQNDLNYIDIIAISIFSIVKTTLFCGIQTILIGIGLGNMINKITSKQLLTLNFILKKIKFIKIIPTKATLYLFLAIILESLTALITFEGLFRELEREQIIEFSIPLIPIFIIAYFLGQNINFQRFSTDKTIVKSILILFGLIYLYIIIACSIQKYFDYTDIITMSLFFIVNTTLFGGIQTIIIGMGLGYMINKSKKQPIESKK